VPVGELEQRAEMFIDNENSLTFGFQPREALPNLEPQQRRQPFGRLIQDEQFRVRHQRATDRQHLLLAAGQFMAHVAAAFRKWGKEIVDALQRPPRQRET